MERIMPISKNPIHIYEPTSLQCGQTVLAMLTDVTVNEIVNKLKNKRETTLKEMFETLDFYSIKYSKQKTTVTKKEDLPPICFLSLETPKCWHWSLYYKGEFLDPEYGVLDDFPPSNRRYYWEIFE